MQTFERNTNYLSQRKKKYKLSGAELYQAQINLVLFDFIQAIFFETCQMFAK